MRCTTNPSLWLAPLCVTQATALAHQYRDPATAQRCGLPEIHGPEHASQWMAQRQREAPFTRLAMHSTRGLVGYGELLWEADIASMCLWMGVDHRRRGLGTELVRALCCSAMDRGMRHVLTDVFADNVASKRALLRAGFVTFDAEAQSDGSARQHLIYSLAPVSAHAARAVWAAFCARRSRDHAD